MKLIAVKGLFGGAGTTTIAANLANAMRRRKHPVIALDLCATNSLRLHFGMPIGDPRGLFRSGRLVDDLREAAFETDNGLIYLPHGEIDEQPDRTDIEGILGGLYELLQRFESPQELIVFIDVPNSESTILNWLTTHAEIMLHVLTPEPRAYPALRYFSRITWPQIQHQGLRHWLLLNQCAPHLELSRDIADLLRRELDPHLLVPTFIQRDQHIPEALATQQTTFDFTIGAQANVEFAAIAEWLEERLEVKQ
ncbi:cellulose synthase operon protein YhjQ [Pseudidiomarina aestuarii]|uniref:Cellulose synthase operon protein YhjQ n=1 Tax=Pseudidiomarina aestuarii TaxID=624146 RepID=A0A7Z6ZSF5_9GAMM|nr:cellulose biosynthesis protein BcsQ [Pseudidiomarina aestuarii]RUO39541.1 cellulose synthase operon protein YhjQ [Pseudidiomarina aestuarii]